MPISAAALDGLIAPASIDGSIGAAALAGSMSTARLAALMSTAQMNATIGGASLAGSIALATSYPTYAGETEFTPSRETQTARTAGRLVMGDITINPIPSNYGLVTWDGSTLTVS